MLEPHLLLEGLLSLLNLRAGWGEMIMVPVVVVVVVVVRGFQLVLLNFSFRVLADDPGELGE